MTKHQYFRLFVFLKPYWVQLLLTGIIVLLFATANVFFIPLVRDISKELSNDRTFYFSMQIVNAIVLWGIRIATQFGQNYMMARISGRVMLDIQETIFKKLHTFSQHFYSEWKLGELLVRLFNDSNSVKDAIFKTFSQLIPQILTLIGVIVYLLTMNWKLTCFTFVAIPIFVLIMIYFSNLVKRLSEQIQKKLSNITHIAQEALVNMKLVQAYTMESETISRFKKQNFKNYNCNITSTRLLETKNALELLLQGIVFISIIFIGGHLVSAGELSGPELLSFFTGCALLIDPVIALSQGFTSLQQCMVSVNRVYKILDLEPSILSPENGYKQTIKGLIELKNVSFKYNPEGPEVLRNISITANPGEVVALVGLSGAGKSTLINLIPRFYDTTEGQLNIDGTAVTEHDINTLRSQIGIVLQDDILFSGTILENIKFGSPDAKEEEVIAAAKAANAWSFIETMPDKLYAKVGDQGRRLSGGQKQRISIARAILRNPKILLLDEATSALDSESEQLVKEALIKLMKGRTTFVIAHRLSTIKHADQIIVLEEGKIIESGTHEELIQKEGKYQSLYHLQFR